MSIASVSDSISVSLVPDLQQQGQSDDGSPADGMSQADAQQRRKFHHDHHHAAAGHPTEAGSVPPGIAATEAGAPSSHPSALLDISA
jgi:hypothetical protein